MRSRHFQDFVQWQRVSGQPLSVNSFTLTPQSRVLIVRFPWGAFLWQRPTAIGIEQNGEGKHLPLVDLTHLMQLGICGLGGVILIASFIRFSRRKEKAS